MTVQVFRLPDLGEGLTDAVVVEYLVAVGDTVAVDETVALVETAKASVDVPCPYAGVVTALHGTLGESLDVGSPLVSVDVGADASIEAQANGSATPAAEQYREEERAGSGNVLIGYGTSEGASTRRRRVGRRRSPGSAPGSEQVGPPRAPGSSDAPAAVLTTAFGERVEQPEADRPSPLRDTPSTGVADRPAAHDAGSPPGTVAATPDGQAIRVISPLVRRLAAERGIDLRTVTPSAPGGIISRADLESAMSSTADTSDGRRLTAEGAYPPHPSAPSTSRSAASSGSGSGSGSGSEERIPLTGIRKLIADKLSTSRREIPDATTWVDVDATAFLELKTQLQEAAPDAGIGFMALLARICVAGLRRYPELNASVDVERQEIVRHGSINLSFAAQSPRGLLVPVVHGADRMSLRELATALRDLTTAARDGSLTPAQLTGGTFTLNNYGPFGVDGSTPILNHPEAAMLGIGRIIERPWVVDGALAVRHVTQLSFTFDHRVADGGSAGGFLRFAADCLEKPGTLLAEL